MSNNESKRLVEYCLNILGRKSYSEFELRRKLSRKTEDVELVAAVLNQLREWGLVDDLEYAKNFVRSSLRIKPKGKYLLRPELSRKGISKEIIDQVILEELPEDQSLLIRELVSKQNAKLHDLTREKRYQRLTGFLLRRGFALDDIRREISKTLD